ncbi:MAG: T9SS type A sorting domain-containing protein [Saprospiraceae bacterium]|nr:T9SS type A sorting domain-containing protein [Saprospiraceae bacterium]
MKHLLAIAVFFILLIGTASAQITPSCEPDSAFLASGALVDPSPYVNDTLGEGLPDACLNTPYDLTIFVNPPTIFAFNGIEIGVDSFTIDSIINLPKGLSFACSAENCLLKAGEVSCIFLSGSPSNENTDTLYKLKIHLKVHTSLFPIPVAFPDPLLAPGHFDLVVHPEGNAACETVAIHNYQTSVTSIHLFPNPVSDVVNFKLEDAGEINDIKIWNQSGALVKTVLTNKSNNQISVEELPAGFYITTVQTQNRIYRSKFIKY